MEECKTGKNPTSLWHHRRQPKMLYGKMLYVTNLTISLSHCTSLITVKNWLRQRNLKRRIGYKLRCPSSLKRTPSNICWLWLRWSSWRATCWRWPIRICFEQEFLSTWSSIEERGYSIQCLILLHICVECPQLQPNLNPDLSLEKLMMM